MRRSGQISTNRLKPAVALLTCAVLLGLGAQPSRAQDFSARPIRIIVGLVAGGATDVTARMIAQKLAESLHASVIVENRAGGIFVPALKELTSSPPDGHTLFMISTSVVVTQPLHPDYPFDLRDLTAITEVASGPLILVARKDLPIKSIAELVAYAKKNPGKLTFGSGGGSGSSLYLATALLKLKTGIELTHVPYKGAAAALGDLLGGHIDLMFDAMPVEVEQVKAGNVTALAVTSANRSPALPDVPTTAEAGIADFEVVQYFGLFAPPGTPPAIAQRLRDEVAAAVAQPDVKAALDQQGMEPSGSEPEQWRTYVAAELERWGKVIRDAGIKPE
jgi:tripartite-type tricarboxylate transporter receptor subunit TctC